MGGRGERVSVNAAAMVDLGLWLYVRCADRILGIDAGTVERALLLDEVDPPASAALADLDAPGGLGCLDVRGVRYGAWDLGLVLGGAPARRAWILLHATFPEGPLPLALRTDECLHVGPPPRGRRLPLPPGAVGRRAAWRSVFAAARVPALHAEPGAVAYEIDLARLWTDDERRLTRAMLSHG
jgi:hypothetical protein